MTTANVPPKPGKSKFLGDMIVAPVTPANNMSDIKTADMTFRVDAEWHKRFKMTAAAHGMSMKDLLMESFSLWEKSKR